MAILRKVGVVVLVVALAVVIGCSSDDAPEVTRDQALVGTWEVTGATINGQPSTINDVINGGDQPVIDGFTVTFEAGGDMIQRVYSGGELLDTETVKWRTSGGKLIFTDGPANMNYEVANDQVTVTWTEDGLQYGLVFEKQ
ncbi:MAG: hypothetical protein R6V19_09895 [Armatimonadota bacterium]